MTPLSESTLDDRSLLLRFADERSDAAFETLVQRHLTLVYSTALRILGGDTHRAQDVTQAVFVALASQAPRLVRHPALSGWLHTTTHHLACRSLRSEQRRSRRERMAHAMLHDTPEEVPDWNRLRPVLDDALHDLREADRLVVLLRFLEGRTLRAVGDALGISEDAARMRIDRALERLRSALARRGVTTSAAALSGTLGVHAAEALPAGLAAQVVLAASQAGAATAATGAFGFLTQIPTQILAMKTPILATTLTAAVVTVPLVLQHHRLEATRFEFLALRDSVSALAGLQEDHDRLRALADLAREIEELRALDPEWARLRDEAAALRSNPPPPLQEVLADARSRLATAEEARADAEEKIQFRATQTRTVNDMKQLGLGARIFATDNEDVLPRSFDQLTGIVDGRIDLDRFEFYPQPRIISELEPQLFIFREKAPRPRPGGGWVRVYTLADGSVQSLESDTEDFSRIEREHYGVASEEIPESLRDQRAYRTDTP
ncbi:MAG: sigma-70 family RNA polymerase sigma factor [Verrucomicrobiae bacterium]|nr:sigma-70 family RNA polymerase sigma factor [Verrucomicrobiae bacterium]